MGLKGKFLCGWLISVDAKFLSVCYIDRELTFPAANSALLLTWRHWCEEKKGASYLSLDFASRQPGGMLLCINKTCSLACKLATSTNSENGIPKYKCRGVYGRGYNFEHNASFCVHALPSQLCSGRTQLFFWQLQHTVSNLLLHLTTFTINTKCFNEVTAPQLDTSAFIPQG